MKFTIMIPTYNQEDLILKALESIPKRKDIEVLIINDCSTDSTYDIAKKWADSNKDNFGYIFIKTNDENCGCGFGKNWAYSAAQGEFIVTLDSDDYFLPNFNNILDDMYNHNEDIVYYGNKINSGEVWRGIDRKATWSYFVKNTFLKKNNLNYNPDARRAGDYEMMKKMKEFNPKIVRLEEVGYHYNYPREGSIVWNYEHGIE